MSKLYWHAEWRTSWTEGVKIQRNVGRQEVEEGGFFSPKPRFHFLILPPLTFSTSTPPLHPPLLQDDFHPSGLLSARSPQRCRGLFPGFPPCRPCSAPCPEASTLPVYPEASPCLVCPLYPVYPACPEVWKYPALPGGCRCRGPSRCRLYPRLLGGCCRTAALCWTIRHLEVTDTTAVSTTAVTWPPFTTWHSLLIPLSGFFKQWSVPESLNITFVMFPDGSRCVHLFL